MYRYDMLLLLLCLADVPAMEEAVKVGRNCILPFIGPRGSLPAEAVPEAGKKQGATIANFFISVSILTRSQYSACGTCP